MGTTKRERQKANRQARLEELARQVRRDKTKRRGIRIAIVVVGGLVLLFGLSRLLGTDDAATTADTTPVTADPSTVTTLDPASTTTLDPSVTTVEASSTTEGATTTEGPTTTVAKEFAFGEGPCPKDDGSSTRPDIFGVAPKLCIDPSKSYSAEITTSKGAFTIALDPEQSPGNVNNFVVLARFHYYDGSTCHRVIKDFALQCGRPVVVDGDTQAAEKSPGYTVADELPAPDTYEPGMVVMANTGQPDTGGGQFFVVIGAEGAALPPQYTIIGKVTKGYDSTVRALANLADPLAANGTPPLIPIDITTVAITQG